MMKSRFGKDRNGVCTFFSNVPWARTIMANELIMNVTLGETRVARLENGVVAELFIERQQEGGVVGNIYKGKVVRVLPGMQAAFVEVGLDRTAYLHVSDVVEETDWDDDDEEESKSSRKKKRARPEIDKLLSEGAEILVQVEKEPMSTKGARLTTHVSLPGRHLVYMPFEEHVGASRRIGDRTERARLKELIHKHRKGKKGGFIVRTVAEGATEDEIKNDITYLTALWEQVEKKAKSAKAPNLVHAELGVLDRVVRDHLTADVDRVVVDDKKALQQMEAFLDNFMPDGKGLLELYQGSEPLFDAFGIEVEITRALGQKVWLKSGGYIIIEQTEALTAIDVNTGRFVGRHDLEDTIVKTNLEAVKEIVYQLRLRNIGGIIILDFIDMEKQTNRNKVSAALKEAMKSDRARSTLSKISELGLVEMTRKRTREDLRRQLGNPCHYCEGRGYLKSPITVCYEIFREIHRELRDLGEKSVVVLCHPQIAAMLYDEERGSLEALEKDLKRRITIKSVAEYHLEQFDISDGK